MRVLCVLDSLGTGGAEFSTLSFYGWLIERGHEIEVVCLKKAKPSYNHRDFGLNKVTYLKPGRLFQRAKSLADLIKAFQPDLVHSVLFDANLTTRICRIFFEKFRHMESIVNEMYSKHRLNDPNINFQKLAFYRLLDWVTQLRGVDHFHANGLSVARHYRQKLGIHSKRISVVPRGRKPNPHHANQEVISEVRQEFGLREELMFINVGRQEYQKGQDTLLKALGTLPEDLRLRLKILLVGREGNLSAQYKKMIAQYQLEDTVLMLGHRQDVPRLLAAADVFVFPSRFEGLPGALIEAEAAALPIICTAIPNNLEVVEPGKNADLFEPDDVQGLKNALIEIVNNKEKRLSYSKKSLEIFNKKFRIELAHKRLECLFLEI